MDRPRLSIGIEEEYQLVDPESRQLQPHINQLIAQAASKAEREIKAELHQSIVELGTSVCDTIVQTRDELTAQRRFISQLAKNEGLEIVAASTHPISRWREQPITPYARYQTILEEHQLLARRMIIFGMHVHIGIEDRDFAIDVMNVVRYMLPHIFALSTSSPFWVGRKTGFKSYRAVLFRDLPRSGIPDVLPSSADYDGVINSLVKAGCIPDASKIWWDVRPHSQYPTLEFRICDICPRVDDAIAIAALLQAVVLWLWNLRQRNITFRVYRRELLEENRWRAARYGLDGKLIDFGKQTEVPTRQLLHELLELVGEAIDELDTAAYIEPIHTILREGTSADRQLAIYDRTNGDLHAVVDHLIAETVQNIG